MDTANTAPKLRKPRKPRSQLTNATNPIPLAQVNPLEASIRQARKAYGSTVGEGEPVPPNALSEAAKGNAGSEGKNGMGEGKAGQGEGRLGMGAPTLPPLPPPRTRGTVETPSQYVKSIPDAVVVAWATSFVTTRNSQRLLADLQPGIGRENQRWRADLVHELERLPLAIETMSQVRSELVMSDLQRRTKLRKIAETEEHALRGYADHIKAIELDAKLDPESNLGRRTEQASGMTFNAPVSLFFMPSTQARTLGAAQPVTLDSSTVIDVSPPLDPPPGGG